jgi:hypothetical protein
MTMISMSLAISQFRPPGYTYTNALAAAWAARNAAPPNRAQGQLLDTLFAALEAGGALAIGDAAYITGPPHHEQAAVVNMLQNRFDGYLTNGCKPELNRGLAGDGAAEYLETLLDVIASGSLKMAQNDAGMIWGTLTSVAVDATASVDLGGASNFFVRRNSADKSISMRAFQGSTDVAFNNAQGAEPAIFGICREGATTVKSYKRGTGLVTTTATASATPLSETFRIGMARSNGFGKNKIPFVLIGKQYTLAQFNAIADAFYNYFHDASVGAW